MPGAAGQILKGAAFAAAPIAAKTGNFPLKNPPTAGLYSEIPFEKEIPTSGEAAAYTGNRRLVDDMYQKTGAFNWKAYMESLPEKSGAEYGDWQEQ